MTHIITCVFIGWAAIPSVPPPDASGGLILWNRGRARFGPNIHISGPSNNLKAIPVPAWCYHGSDPINKHEPRWGGYKDSGFTSQIHRPSAPTTACTSAARDDPTQCLASPEGTSRAVCLHPSRLAFRTLPSPVRFCCFTFFFGAPK